ncbi:MAG: aldo/keto reductase, partial [Methanomicrobiales archaeon]|nr:aldo/keto reductase [Methanomicrobiales archaeon]
MERIKECILGRTGRTVTCVGLGGEGILRTYGRTKEAASVIQAASAQGISYWDSARAYDGSEGYYGVFWSEDKKERSKIFQTSKSARRDRRGALEDLHTTLSLMHIPVLDLWQIHDVRTEEDVARIEGTGGALEAFVEAKEQGLVTAIGVTGHYDPAILIHAIETWPLDTVLLPV